MWFSCSMAFPHARKNLIQGNIMSNNYKKIIHICFGVGLLVAAMAPQATQKSQENPAASWSQGQIETRIQELENQRAQRLALMRSNHPEANHNRVASSVGVLSQLLPNALVLLGIGAVPALLLLLWQMKRAQPVVVFDWERSVTLQTMPQSDSVIRTTALEQSKPQAGEAGRAASGRAAPGRAFPDTFDSIDYEVVRVKSSQAHADARESLASQASEANKLDTVDLIEQATPLAQAKFWSALDKSEVAISILEEVIEQERTPQSWLFLLDLYAKTNKAASYESMRLRFKTLFNGKIPPLAERAKAQGQLRLKDLPDLAGRINQHLSGNGIYSFLRSLLLDERQGSRQGFEYSVYCDLVHLYDALCHGQKIERCEAICA